MKKQEEYQMIMGDDVGSSFVKWAISPLNKKAYNRYALGKVRTMVNEITENDFRSREVSSAIQLDFVGGEQRQRYFAVGDAARARSSRDNDWSFKYTPSIFTPAFWYSIASAFKKQGVPCGAKVNLRIAVTHNVHTPANTVRDQAFPCGFGPDNVYHVRMLNVDNAGTPEYMDYDVTIEDDERAGYLFPKETKAAMILRQLNFKERGLESELNRPYVLMDIGWSTSQVYVVSDNTVQSWYLHEAGIGELQRRVRSGLATKYNPHELQTYDLEAYMRDAGRLPADRHFNNTAFLSDVIELMLINGREMSDTLVGMPDAGYLRQPVLAGGGGVQMLNLITLSLEGRKSRGDIMSFNLPTLLLDVNNNEFGNALGAYKAIWGRNGVV